MTTESIAVTLRPGRLGDLPEVVAIANACARGTTGHDELTLENSIEEWRDPSMNLETNTRVAVLPNGTIAGCIEVWSSEPYVSHWVWGRVDPAQRGQGIGTALMEWAEARVGEYIALAPAGARVTVDAASPNNHQPTTELMLDRGFVVVRESLTMERSLEGALPLPHWPVGIAPRPMRQEDHRELFLAIDEAWHDHWGYVEQPEETAFPVWMHRMAQRLEYDPALWIVAWEGDEIAGAALCYPSFNSDTTHGWVSRLAVRRAWRKRGLGEALLYAGFGALQSHGCMRVGLGVDAQSLTGATRLYERVGLRPIQRSVSFEKVIRAGHDLSTQALAD